MISKVTFVLGFQGVGKSHYIAEHHPLATVIDYERWWQNYVANMEEIYEKSQWVKIMAAFAFQRALQDKTEDVVVECTGVTKINQSAVRGLITLAHLHGYDTAIVYLSPKSEKVLLERIKHDPIAYKMLADCIRERKERFHKWRSPPRCPFFEDVETVVIDHSQFTEAEPEILALEFGASS